MLRTFIWLLSAVILVIAFLPVLLILWITRKPDRFSPIPKTIGWITGNIIPPMTKLGGCDYEIFGQENIPEGPALFAGNHQGDFDVLMILFAFKRVPVIIAKIEAKIIPIINVWMNLMHSIFMDRNDMRQSLLCIKEAEEQLRHGNSVIVFPEGTRSKGPDMGEFKAGAFKAAVNAGVPVVPFVIDGTYKVFEQQNFFKKTHVSFTILPPVTPFKNEKTTELSERVQAAIEAELLRQRSVL